MARILREEIRWADLNPVRGREQAGLRPVLVLTSQEPRAGFPLVLESRAPSLPKRSWIRISQIRTPLDAGL